MPEKIRINTVITNSPQETIMLGQQLAIKLTAGDVVYLYGDLGSGKTVLVKGICKGLGVTEEVTSSSFVIATEYRGQMPISHLDLYRLNSDTLEKLPIDEYILEDGITIIEWADRIDRQGGVRIFIDIKGKSKREIKIEDFRD